MPLGAEVGVGLGTGHIVLDGDPAPPFPPPERGTAAAPTFWPMSIVAERSAVAHLSNC